MEKEILLKGNTNLHSLKGKFKIQEKTKGSKEFSTIEVEKESVLLHEKPNGEWSNEHKTLIVEKGNYKMGKQVEYNPFSKSISAIWD